MSERERKPFKFVFCHRADSAVLHLVHPNSIFFPFIPGPILIIYSTLQSAALSCLFKEGTILLILLAADDLPPI